MKGFSTRIRKMLCLLLLLSGAVSAFAQSTVGTDFWVAFMPNGTSDNSISLDLVSASHCNSLGTITNEYAGFTASFEVIANEVTTINLPEEIAYFGEQSDVVLHNAFHVTTTNEIALYASNYKISSYDVGKLLPTDALGSEYVLQTYPSDGMYDYACPVFSVIAIEDNTEVLINLTSDSKGGHYANQPFTVVLDKGECYQVQAFSDGDFSGTWLQAVDGKNIAVFAGNTGVVVPIGHYAYEAIFEQMPPVESWGKRFVVTCSKERINDRVRVTALNDGCKVYKDGVLLTTLDARQTTEFGINNVPRSAVYLETTEPALVYLYTTSMSYGDVNQSTGDPSMVNILPFEQATGNYAVIPVFDQGGWYHIVYVNVVTETGNVDGVYMDGVSVASSFEEVPGQPDYSYARLPLTPFSHVLMSMTGNFIAHTYGFAPAESYAFVVGTELVELTSQITVNEETALTHPQGFEACEDEIMTFGLQTNFEPTLVQWNFGDGTTASGFPVTHTVIEEGNYTVSCEVYENNQGQNVLVATLETTLHVHPKYTTEIYLTACNSYDTIGVTYTESGVYEFPRESVFGCDSTFILNLALAYDKLIDTTITACNEFVWNGQTYNESGVYEYKGQSVQGCDSIVQLNLTIGQGHQGSLLGLTQVSAASDIISGFYEYCVPDSLNIAPNTLNWSCTNLDWIASPCNNGYRCQLLVTNIGQGTLTAQTEHNCDTVYSIDINATWFDVSENLMDKVMVYPNPAQQQVTIEASQITRIRLMNSLGQLVGDWQYDDVDTTTLEVEGFSQGVYLMEICTKQGRAVRRLMLIGNQ